MKKSKEREPHTTEEMAKEKAVCGQRGGGFKVHSLWFWLVGDAGEPSVFSPIAKATTGRMEFLARNRKPFDSLRSFFSDALTSNIAANIHVASLLFVDTPHVPPLHFVKSLYSCNKDLFIVLFTDGIHLKCFAP